MRQRTKNIFLSFYKSLLWYSKICIMVTVIRKQERCSRYRSQDTEDYKMENNNQNKVSFSSGMQQVVSAGYVVTLISVLVYVLACL